MTEEPKSYLKQVATFYFAPIWQSFFTIFYLLFFFYFAVFHSGKLWLASKFLLYTIGNSAELLGLSYLFLGVVFLISLIIPFSVSIYAILLLFEIWEETKWEQSVKLLVTSLIIATAPLLIIVMDDIIRFVASQPQLQEFIFLNNIHL
ncbi:MAG: hypothetical protein Q8R36_00360 [bacterium]|nr:hypothetical protein [bacterium]